jgi:hypothetical protein
MKANLVDDLLAYDPAVHTEMGKGVERTYGLPCGAPAGASNGRCAVTCLRAVGDLRSHVGGEHRERVTAQ